MAAVASPSARTWVRRHPERGAYDRETIEAILDEALICHLGFVHEGQPFVIPTIHARAVDVCVTVTLPDGVVLARSVYNHSMNYRSVVVLGRARRVEERSEKLGALEAIVEQLVPGRSADARGPSDKELAGTLVLSLPLEEAAAKVRVGPPKDFDDDVDLPVWAGVIPLELAAARAEPASDVPEGVSVPGYVTAYRR